MKSGIALITALFASASWAEAGLEFENPVQQLAVKVSDKEISTRFVFKVTGDKAVKITDIRTLCSCVKAETLDGRMEFQPGESGVIETAFEVGGFEGVVKKEVVVTTDDLGEEPVRLVLEATIPGLLQISPVQLVWQVGEAPEAKKVHIKVMGDDPVRVTGVVSSRGSMKAVVREILPGKEYEVTATPDATESKMLGMLRIETDSQYPRYQKKLVFFNITERKAGVPAAAPAR